MTEYTYMRLFGFAIESIGILEIVAAFSDKLDSPCSIAFGIGGVCLYIAGRNFGSYSNNREIKDETEGLRKLISDEFKKLNK